MHDKALGGSYPQDLSLIMVLPYNAVVLMLMNPTAENSSTI